jgi:hypothetical protein
VNLGVDGSAEPNPISGGHAVSPLPAPFAVMKFEPWLAMMQVLLRLFDSHIHPTPKGPSGPPAVPLSPAISPLLSTVRSVRVGVGL